MTLNQLVLLGMFAACINMGIALREGWFGSFLLNAFVLMLLL